MVRTADILAILNFKNSKNYIHRNRNTDTLLKRYMKPHISAFCWPKKTIAATLSFQFAGHEILNVCSFYRMYLMVLERKLNINSQVTPYKKNKFSLYQMRSSYTASVHSFKLYRSMTSLRQNSQNVEFLSDQTTALFKLDKDLERICIYDWISAIYERLL